MDKSEFIIGSLHLSGYPAAIAIMALLLALIGAGFFAGRNTR